jgi:HicB family
MELEAYVQALREDVSRLAALGDESTRQAAEMLVLALESSLGRRLQEGLTEAALELSGQLPQGRVEVRIAGSEPELVYVDERVAAPAEPGDEAQSARITLRLPESLKSRLEAAAAAGGVSVNTWLVQALSRMLEPRTSAGPSGRRLTGYGRS